MRDLITVVCFVGVLAWLGLAERFYVKWKTYAVCSEVNLMTAQGQLEKTRAIVESNTDLLHVETIDEAVDLCRTKEF